MLTSDQFELCFKNLDDVVFIMEFPSLVYRYISPSIEKLRGYTPEEVYADPMVLYRHMPHVNQQVIVDYLSSFIGKGPVYFEYLMETKEGEVKWHSSSFSIVEKEGGDYMLSGIMRDITKRKETAFELEKLKVEYEDLYQNAPFGYYSLDADGNFIRINDTLLRWLGYEREEMIGKNITDVLLTEDGKKNFEHNFPIFKRKGFINDLRFDYKRKNGTTINVLLNASAVLDDKGDFQSSRSVATDITELTEAEQQLKRSQTALEAINEELQLANQKLERLNITKDILLKIISHDLRNPLETIKLISSLLHVKYEELDKETVLKYVDYINSSGYHATDIIDNMSGVLSLGSELKLKKQPCLVSAIVQEVLNLNKARAEKKGILLHYAIDEEKLDTCKVLADPKWLVRAIDNLVVNAIKFSHSGDEVKIGCYTEGDWQVMTIADNGIGIPAEVQETLFTKFSEDSRLGTDGEAGTGLGLSIVRQIVEMHAGQVWVESKEGVGSVFRIKLPAAVE